MDGFFPAPREFSKLSGGVDKAAFDAFRTRFAEAPNITVYLHANVTRIRREDAKIVGLDVARLALRPFRATHPERSAAGPKPLGVCPKGRARGSGETRPPLALDVGGAWREGAGRHS